jgi:hypothetical protein
VAGEHHVEIDTEGNEYYSIRTRSSGELLGMRGLDQDDPFSTLSMRAIGMAPDWPQTFASSRGLPLNTVVSELTERMGYYGDDSRQTVNAAKNLIAPSTAWSGPADFWRNVRARRASGGRTIKRGVVVQSKWTSVCPESGITTYSTKVKFEENVGSAPAAAITEDAAFATPVAGEAPGWRILAVAANKTASTTFRSISEVNSANATFDPPTPARAVRYLDAVMMAGNPGVIVVPAIARIDDPGWRQYVVTPAAGSAFLAPEFTRNITGLTVDVGGNGVIQKIVTSFSVSPNQTVITFTP